MTGINHVSFAVMLVSRITKHVVYTRLVKYRKRTSMSPETYDSIMAGPGWRDAVAAPIMLEQTAGSSDQVSQRTGH